MIIRNLLAAAALFGATALHAQPIAAVAPIAPPAQPLQTPEQLETLVSPIALYPDPLVSIILPAATAPGEIVIADRYLQQGGDAASIDSQSWDDSVRAVAHYPELISWLDQNLAWTEQLGAAFLDQPADVMNTIQRLRQNARAAGILVDTPQQQVIVQQEYVYIEPAQPNVIYIPSYDPDIFYASSRGYGRSLISFELAFATGPWLSYEPDWGRRSIWIDRRREGSRRDWRPPSRTEIAVNIGRQQWHPTVDVSHRPRPAAAPTVTGNQNITNNVVTTTRAQVARPTPITRTRNNDARRAATAHPADATTFNPPRAQPPPAAAPPAPPRHEPVLTPTGRMPEPRIEPERERAREPEHREAPVATPSPRERERAHEKETAPTPQATPVPGVPPARVSTPPPPAKGQPPPPPQAKPEEPRGKAKGHERDQDDDDHDNDDRKKRGD